MAETAGSGLVGPTGPSHRPPRGNGHAEGSQQAGRSVDDLLAEYMQRLDAGEKIDRNELYRAHPEVADELAAYFEAEDAFSNIFADSAIRQAPAVPPDLNVAMVELVEDEEDTVDALDEDTDTIEDPRREPTPVPFPVESPLSGAAWRLTAAMLLVALVGMAIWSWQRVLSRAGVAARNPVLKANTSPFTAGDEVWEGSPGANWTAKNRPGLLSLFEDEAQHYAFLLSEGEKIRFGTPDESYSGQRCLVSFPAPPVPPKPVLPVGTAGTTVKPVPTVPAPKKGEEAAKQAETSEADKKEAAKKELDKKELDKKGAEAKEPDKKELDKADQKELGKKELDKKEADKKEKDAKRAERKAAARRLHPLLPAAVETRPGPVGFRYLRFAWKKTGGEGILVRLYAADGRTFVYYAGEVGELTEPSVRIARTVPTEWTLVERDLAADFGPFSLNAIAVSMADGPQASFDHVYLARNTEMLAKTTPRNPPKVVPPPAVPIPIKPKTTP
jgi:hypothetical protein